MKNYNNDNMVQLPIDIEAIRKEFPVLHQKVQGFPLVYFDNAATTQKPNRVIDAIQDYYHKYNSNIHRGAHTLADKATILFEDTREAIRSFINASSIEEVIFTRGTTEGLNLLASSLGEQLNEGDEVIISTLEHHSNIVPWQMMCERKKAVLKVIPANERGELDIEAYKKLLSASTKIVSCQHVSNALGVVHPVEEMIQLAHASGAVFVVDGAQAASHIHLDMQALDCDFYVFSAHKMYGPTGIGALYGKKHLLEEMPPYMGGGEMIDQVSFEKTTYNQLPYKFEAGTPNIADTIAFKAALDFMLEVGVAEIAAWEHELLTYATQLIKKIPSVRIIGDAKNKTGVLSFIVEGIHHYDLGMMLDTNGVAVRTGHHCAQPLMDRFEISGTVRASFAVYNTKEEVDTFIKALKSAIMMLS